MGNSKTDKEVKIYKNSECFRCFSVFKELSVVTNSITKQKVIICDDCYKDIKNNSKKE